MKAQDAYFYENGKEDVQLVGYRAMNKDTNVSFTNVRDSNQLHRKRFLKKKSVDARRKKLKDQVEARRQRKMERSDFENSLRVFCFLCTGL